MKRGMLILFLFSILFISGCGPQQSRDVLSAEKLARTQIDRSFSDGWQYDYDFQPDWHDDFWDHYNSARIEMCLAGDDQACEDVPQWEFECYQNHHPCEQWPQYETGEWECGIGECGASCGEYLACDDGNPCSKDSCSDHECVHEYMEPGQMCAYGNTYSGDNSYGNYHRCVTVTEASLTEFEAAYYSPQGDELVENAYLTETIVCREAGQVGDVCDVDLNCAGAETPIPTAFCDDITNSNNPTCQLHHCGNGVVESQFDEECDNGGSNDWWGSECLPNCRLPNRESRSSVNIQNTGIPCDSDSDSITEDNWYCPTEIDGFITPDTECYHGFNIWDAGTIDAEFYNSGEGQSDRCVDGPMGLKFLEEYWCDLSENCNGQGCVMKMSNIDCAALVIDPETAEVDPSVEDYSIVCPDDDNPTARPQCVGYPSPPDMPSCGNGICSVEECVCSDSGDETPECNGATCEWEDCLTCPEDCGVCQGNGECDNGNGNVANAGETCYMDCVDSNGDGSPDTDTCLSQDLSGDNCGSCLNDEHCGPFETIQNSAACAISDEFPLYGYLYVGGMDDDWGCGPTTSSKMYWGGGLDSGAFSWGDCGWSGSESTDGCVSFAMEDDCGCGWTCKTFGTGCDDCSKGIHQRGYIIDFQRLGSSQPFTYGSLSNWAASYDATQPGNWWDWTGSDAACVHDDHRYYQGMASHDNWATYLCALAQKPSGAQLYKWLKCDKNNKDEVHYDTLHQKMYTCTEDTVACTSGCSGFTNFKKYIWEESSFLAGNCGPGNIQELYRPSGTRGDEEYRCVSYDMSCKTERTGHCGVEPYTKYMWEKVR